jgi:hypothetical protein
MRGLFSVFPYLGRKVIKAATNEEICFVICPSYTRKSKLIKEKKGAAARKSNQMNIQPMTVQLCLLLRNVSMNKLML